MGEVNVRLPVPRWTFSFQSQTQSPTDLPKQSTGISKCSTANMFPHDRQGCECTYVFVFVWVFLIPAYYHYRCFDRNLLVGSCNLAQYISGYHQRHTHLNTRTRDDTHTHKNAKPQTRSGDALTHQSDFLFHFIIRISTSVTVSKAGSVSLLEKRNRGLCKSFRQA